MILKGKIVRRISNGVPVGQYMYILRVEKEGVYAKSLESPDQNEFLIMRPNLHIPSIHTIIVSGEILIKLRTRKIDTVTHPYHSVSKKWKNLIKEKPELVRFTTDWEGSSIFKVENISTRMLAGTNCIVLKVGIELWQQN